MPALPWYIQFRHGLGHEGGSVEGRLRGWTLWPKGFVTQEWEAGRRRQPLPGVAFQAMSERSPVSRGGAWALLYSQPLTPSAGW